MPEGEDTVAREAVEQTRRDGFVEEWRSCF